MITDKNKTLDDLPPFCSVADLLEVLCISRATAYRLAGQGKIPCIRLGRRIILSRDCLKSWIEEEMGEMTMARRMKGEGSLYQAADKTWIYQYKINGKRKTKRFHRKAEAKAFIESVRFSVEAPVSVMPTRESCNTMIHPITISEWMDHWLENYAKPIVKLSTYSSYELYIRGHIKPKLGTLYMNTLRVDDLQRFFNERSKNGNLNGKGGLSPKTLTNMRNMMHLSFEQAVKNGMLLNNPISGVCLPRVAKKEMRVLTRQEQERLILAAQQAPEPAAFGVIFDLFTGLRIGELCALRWENVDMKNKLCRICETRNRLPNFDDSIKTSTSVKTAQTTKTDNSRRTVYLMSGLFQDFKEYHAIQISLMEQYPGYNAGDYVFCQENGEPYEPRTYQDLFKRCVRRAGIADANFHSLRHTFAARSLEQGMDVVTLSRLLGHANPSITLDKYGHAMDEHKQKSVEKLDALYPDSKGILVPETEEVMPLKEMTMGMG